MSGRLRIAVMISALSGVAVYACVGDSTVTPQDGGPDVTVDAPNKNDVSTSDAPGDTSCGDTSSDPNNCGSCGHVCAADQGCHSGVCGKEAVEIAAGYNSACAIMKDQSVWCWGENRFGEIGVDSSGDVACSAGPCRPQALQVNLGGQKVLHVSVGVEYACVVETNNSVWCWGKNHRGQLGHSPALDGDAAVPFNYTPTQVKGLPPVAWVAAGVESTCAVTTAGAMWCWGNDGGDQLDADGGAPVYTSTPVAAATLTANLDKIKNAITFSENHLCTRKTDGTEWCWGDNTYDDRGSTVAAATPPSQVGLSSGPTDISDFATGKFTSCALRTGGSLWCWGQNDMGMFGNPSVAIGTVTPTPTWTDAGAVSFSSISARTTHMCALTPTNDLYCWGDDSDGQLGIGATLDGGVQQYNALQKIPSFAARAVSAGTSFTVAIKTDGTVWAWGDNSEAQTGHAQTSTDLVGCPQTYCTLTPTQVQGLPF